MFCPNCAAQNETAQHYCRACGLKLDAIVESLSSQRPSEEFALLLKRRRRFEMLGAFFLSMAGVVGLSILIAAVFYYKMQWVGPQILFGSASIALVVFTLLSGFFLSYPKIMMKLDRFNVEPMNSPKVEAVTTRKLIDERPFEPISSVTEDATELLPVRNKSTI
jgi:hypothetical protein